MNVLTNSLRLLPNLIRNVTRVEGYVARNYAFKSDLKIKWVRPEKIECWKAEKSGDLGLDLKIGPQDLAYRYNRSTELQDADENVKKLFTLEYLPARYMSLARTNTAIGMVRRHRLDRGSMEVKIAAMTNAILQMQQRLEICRRDAKLRVRLKELIDKRRKFLGYLRAWDYKRFEWIIEKLNIVFRPYPFQHIQVWRKPSLRKLTRTHCRKLVSDKLNAYKEELESQKKEFFKEKAEKLAFIREQELFCGVEPTISEKSIEEAKEKYESLK